AAATFDARARALRDGAAADWAAANALDGATIGAWRVVGELGRGGMGVVLLVERADGQFEQRAALKLIKRGMDSDAVLARFLRERQILARLEHRNIARLLDGGVAADGRPYFVMEYVDGVPLPRYCAERGSDLDERLRLFFGVCAAVQFAHAQLVVHSDLKPSNVLVGAGGDVKLLDFGIAKLLGEQDAAATQTRERPLTPAYAAPEQIRGEPVTTATDVYALGCLLYELLTGRRPFEVGDAPTLDELRRLLASSAPPAPSQSGGGAAPVAPKRLRGDLDTIVLKALKSEPERRYATVDALAEDLRRYRAGQPIAAHRDSGLYRARKFVARHRAGVATSALGAIALAGAIGAALWQAREKSAEAEASREVAEFLVGLFAASDPTHTRGASVSAKDLLDQGAARLDRREFGSAALRARFLQTIAASYAALGLYERARPIAERALALRRAALAADDPAVAESMDALGRIDAALADYAEAEPLLRSALAARRRHLAADDPALIESLGHFGALLHDRGDFDAAEAPLREALGDAERRFGADAIETAAHLDDYATNLQSRDRPVEATAQFRRALAVRERALGGDDPDVAASLHNLGVNLTAVGRYAEAKQMLERALAIRRRVYGAAHPLLGYTELALATVHEYAGELAAAEPLAQQALAIFRTSLVENHRKVAESLNLLAMLHFDRRAYADAAAMYRDVLARYRASLGADHPDSLIVEENLA
ncbi:MAG TPA: serine/threonine-protein kinase, partial [Dokdonella sp.]